MDSIDETSSLGAGVSKDPEAGFSPSRRFFHTFLRWGDGDCGSDRYYSVPASRSAATALSRRAT